MKVTSVHRPEHAPLVRLLRELRLQAGLTQADVGQKLGVSQTAISDIEINERGADFLLVLDLCDIYGVSHQDFLAEFGRRLSEEKIEPIHRIKRKDRKQL